MNHSKPFQFGEPPFDDVEAAAQLLARYDREAPLTSDYMRVFLRMVKEPRAVVARARQIRELEQPPPAASA